MIYKFEDSGSRELDIYRVDGSSVCIQVNNQGDKCYFYLEKDDLYDLIGALHSLQTKIKNGGKDGN